MAGMGGHPHPSHTTTPIRLSPTLGPVTLDILDSFLAYDGSPQPECQPRFVSFVHYAPQNSAWLCWMDE